MSSTLMSEAYSPEATILPPASTSKISAPA